MVGECLDCSLLSILYLFGFASGFVWVPFNGECCLIAFAWCAIKVVVLALVVGVLLKLRLSTIHSLLGGGWVGPEVGSFLVVLTGFLGI